MPDLDRPAKPIPTTGPDDGLWRQEASSERDRRFLATIARCAAVWALTLAAMIPALSGGVRAVDGSWMAVGLVLLSLALGLVPGQLFSSTLAEVLHPQTLIMATAAVAAACWGLAASGPPWPVLAMVALLGGAAASTFAADTHHYWRALAGDDPGGPDITSIAYLGAAVGVVFGLSVAVLVGYRVVEAVAAISMAILCLAALISPSLRHHPFESPVTENRQ